MAEANFPGPGPSSDIPSFDQLAKLKDDFMMLDPSQQRGFMEWVRRWLSEDIKSSDTERLEALRSQGEEGPDTSSAVDQTLVGRQLANGNDQVATLVEAINKKNVLEAALVNEVNGLSRNLKDTEKVLENATVRMGEMQSMLKKAETKLSASEEMCNELTIQVNNLLDELKDRDTEIHTMADSAQRSQAEFEAQLADITEENGRFRQQNPELSEHLEELRADRERMEAEREQLADVLQDENALLRQQVEEEIGRNQIFTSWLNNARRYLRQGEPPLPQEEPPLPQEERLLAQPFDLPDTEVIQDTLE